MPAELACIVEGQGDLEAVPILVRRIAQEQLPGTAVRVHPFRIPRTKLLKEGELERAVELAARRVGQGGGILILLDSDDDCPALLARAARARSDFPVRVVLAHRELEAWFLAGAESLRGRRGLRNDLQSPEDPESIRGAKEWLTHHMPGGQRYVETLDQPALAAVLDLAASRRADSFDKLWRDIAWLLARYTRLP
jgi:Domain of unknown function (DUF4276)